MSAHRRKPSAALTDPRNASRRSIGLWAAVSGGQRLPRGQRPDTVPVRGVSVSCCVLCGGVVDPMPAIDRVPPEADRWHGLVGHGTVR